MKNVKKLRTAIVGFGFMGRTHALNILQSDKMDLVAIVDHRIDSLDQAAGNIQTGAIDVETLAKVKIYASLDDCLAQESLDLVYLSVPTPLHHEMGMKILGHGAHLFVEKPFVLKVSEGEALIKEAAAVQRKIGVAHVVRFMPAYLYLKELYQNKKYGDLKFISLTRLSGLPDWGDWTKQRHTFGVSGGALFDLNIHDIDFLNYLLGSPDKVNATVLPGVLSTHDYFSAFWSYDAKDIKVKVEGGNFFHSRTPFRAEYLARFDQATISWSSMDDQVLAIADDKVIEMITLNPAIDGYREEGDYFARAILEEFYPEECSASSALESIRLCYRHTC